MSRPTTLDIDTLDLLEELLIDYKGTILLGQSRPRLFE